VLGSMFRVGKAGAEVAQMAARWDRRTCVKGLRVQGLGFRV